MASESYSQIPSSSTSPPTGTYDVFLSFRGKDTRYAFTDHLYKALDRNGIKTFRDNPELRSGEVISDSLIKAIQQSKTYIVVLSKNYASSSWCLGELVEILRCHETMKRLVVPVFYHIDPYVVRHHMLSRDDEEAFEKHQTRYDVEKVEKWRRTLHEVAGFSGYQISKKIYEGDIVNKVVESILLKINPVTLNVAKYPVGLDSRVEGVTALFNNDVETVIKIGIYGMGGVGKTTLAKAVYNQNCKLFKGSCFLANVRETSGAEKGIVCLQKQLISDVLKCKNSKDIDFDNVDRGIEIIRDRLRSIKVLIVIDDLDDPNLLDFLDGSFAFGSTIIITTRNEDLLDTIKVQARYKLNELDDDQSRQLFAQHAFGDNKISDKFTELSKDILKRAGGLPLALKVFGSFLHNQPEKEWTWFIDNLSQVRNDDIENKLMISFNALKSADLQDIFLDIACFFTGVQKATACRILETCYTSADRNIDILKKRCMITIDEVGKLGMHDLLRDMGKNIARNNFPVAEPGKHSRLWVSEDIRTVLKNPEGTEEIQAIISSDFRYGYVWTSRVTFNAQSFIRMRKLKFLYLNNVNLTGSFKQIFKDLRWLCWTHFPQECLPSEFNAEKLVTLELPHSNMRTWEAAQEFKKLKTLNMYKSEKLETTPNFIRLPCLETLNLQFCSSLEEVHVSIGSLASLVNLNLGSCVKLRSLPDSICSLRALEVLEIRSCIGLEALPTELGNIESLKELKAQGLRVSRVPDSIGRLSNLVELDLSFNENLETLPDNICNLRSLEILNLDCCLSLKRLPNLCNFKHLTLLRLEYCTCLTEIQGLEEVTSLNDLYLRHCSYLQRLPNLCNLKHLESLDLAYCKRLTEIQGLEEVTSLNNLNLDGCRSLQRLPNLCNLKHLTVLELRGCRCLTEIQGLEELTSLEKLDMAGCNSSLLACTLTKCFFQILSGFGHRVEIFFERKKLPDWISQLSKVNSYLQSNESHCFHETHTVSWRLDLQPNESHSFLAIILDFEYAIVANCSVKIRSGSIWSEYLVQIYDSSLIVIIPSSILSIRDGDDKIEITISRDIYPDADPDADADADTDADADADTDADTDESTSDTAMIKLDESCAIYLLYKTEITMTSHPSLSDLESKMNSLSLGGNTDNLKGRRRRRSQETAPFASRLKEQSVSLGVKKPRH